MLCCDCEIFLIFHILYILWHFSWLISQCCGTLFFRSLLPEPREDLGRHAIAWNERKRVCQSNLQQTKICQSNLQQARMDQMKRPMGSFAPCGEMTKGKVSCLGRKLSKARVSTLALATDTSSSSSDWSFGEQKQERREAGEKQERREAGEKQERREAGGEQQDQRLNLVWVRPLTATTSIDQLSAR